MRILPALVPALVLALSVVLAPSPARAELPNIVVFLADDMGMGDTSAFQDWTGNADGEQIATPQMERLAAGGVRFTDAHAPSSRCSPSRYALMTGRYCWRTHLKHWVLFGVHCDPLIERDRTTLPEFLQGAGYRTGMVGKWHLGVSYRNGAGEVAAGWEDADLTKPMADTPVDHGFDFFYGITRSHPTSGPNTANPKAANGPAQSKGPGWIEGRNILGATGDGKRLEDGAYDLHRIGEVLHRESLAWLDQEKADPFFLYFASPANHTPYTPDDEVGGVPIAGASRFKDGAATGSVRLDWVYENDVLLGLLLDYLDTTDDPRNPGHSLAANTLVIFASDNGAESKAKTATGPVRSNKGSVYEGGHRIPFIARWPEGGVDGGRSNDRLLAMTDVFATLAEVVGRELPEDAAEDSFSQLAALRGDGDAGPRPSAVFSNDHNEASKKLSDERAWVGISSRSAPGGGQWKLLLDHRYAFGGELHPQELYHLSEDLQESENLIDDPEAKPALDYLLEEARRAAGDDGRTRPRALDKAD